VGSVKTARGRGAVREVRRADAPIGYPDPVFVNMLLCRKAQSKGITA
jgi:hypothetical protein